MSLFPVFCTKNPFKQQPLLFKAQYDRRTIPLYIALLSLRIRLRFQMYMSQDAPLRQHSSIAPETGYATFILSHTSLFGFRPSDSPNPEVGYRKNETMRLTY